MAEGFRHRLRVRYAECDPQGVVFNSRYLEYFDIAITELWREALGPYDDVMREHNIDLVVAEATVRYLAPLGFDQEFDLLPRVTHIGTTSMTTSIAVEPVGAARSAEGEIRHVFVKYGTSEKTPIPDPIRQALEGHAQAAG